MAFRPSTTNKGISVFDKECAKETSGDICNHIEKFYSEIAGIPIVFWEIPAEIIPQGCRIKQSVSNKGDECHHDIFDWEAKESEKTIKNVPLDNLEICIGEDEPHRKFQLSDLPDHLQG